ncbi:hypothetical protein GOP47_0024037 [Adiantum capillus-veneris]|uniref:TF-B3 domain-containing protein n=1 Tax=Adiantum capillus-veneris TaxID=13818 RepID=A0A9D4U529_ADICA|nr:hypothetical protein GOP47_0024037 [Adiantum capillus-veneris]
MEEEEQAAKFPYTFMRTLTRTNVDKHKGFLELPMKVSKVCWALGMEGEMKMVVGAAVEDRDRSVHSEHDMHVMRSSEEGQEWMLRWWSGRKQGRGDRISGSGWLSFVSANKLACGDVVALTLLSLSLLSISILQRAAVPAKVTGSAKAVEEVSTHVASSSPLPLLQQAVALPGPAGQGRRVLCYLKLQQSHMQEGKPILMDLPSQFTRQLLPLAWNAESSAQNSSLHYAFTSSDWLREHGIQVGDFCVFELLQDADDIQGSTDDLHLDMLWFRASRDETL